MTLMVVMLSAFLQVSMHSQHALLQVKGSGTGTGPNGSIACAHRHRASQYAICVYECLQAHPVTVGMGMGKRRTVMMP